MIDKGNHYKKDESISAVDNGKKVTLLKILWKLVEIGDPNLTMTQ